MHARDFGEARRNARERAIGEALGRREHNRQIVAGGAGCLQAQQKIDVIACSQAFEGAVHDENRTLSGCGRVGFNV